MGFFRSIFRPIANLIDPLLPESVKSAANKLNDMTGGLAIGGSIFEGIQNEDSGGGPAPAPAGPDIGRLEQSEMDELAAKRLARIGRYFTTPLGILNTANTGSSKVFS